MSDGRRLGGDGGEDLLDRGQIAGRARSDLDHVAPGTVLQLVRGAGVDDTAVVDDDDLAGELVGFLEVLGREQDVDTVGDEVADRLPELAAAPGVEPGGGLVEQQETGPADEARPEVEPRRMPPE